MTEVRLPPDEMLAALLRALPDVVVVLDAEGRVRWANRVAERTFERSLAESVGQPALDLVHPDDLELVLRSLASVQRKDVGTLIEVRAKAPSGWRLLEVLGTPVEWSGERVVLFSMRDLTERRRFEVARNQEARFRSILQNTAAVIFLVTAGGFVESASGALSRVLGHDPELVEGQSLAALVLESDRPALRAALDRASRGSPAASPVTISVQMLRYPGDDTLPFELSIVNLLDDPIVGGYIVSAHDITARATAELELGRTLSLLTATLDATADGIVVLDEEGVVASFNRRFAEMWRIPESILASNDVAAVSFVLEQLAGPEAFLQHQGDPRAGEDESRDLVQLRDGRVFERYSRPQRVGDHTVGRVLSFRDVTESRRAEAALRDTMQHFSQLFDQAPFGLALVDDDSNITDANTILCELLGRRPEELLGARLGVFMHPEDAEREGELDRKLSQGIVANYEAEVRLIKSDGQVAVGRLRASLIRQETGAPICGLRIVEDVTEHKRLQSELEAHAETARAVLGRLTPREREILELSSAANSAAEMAALLSVSVRTVESHLARIYRKLGVRSREAAVAEFTQLKRTAAGSRQVPNGDT
jgi:PAS domain S-box-containing protein